LESVNGKLKDAEFQLMLVKEKARLEWESLSNELELKCQKMRTLQMEYKEAVQVIDEEKATVRKLETLVAGMRETAEKDRCEANVQAQRLKKEISAKEETVGRLKGQIAELARDNECAASENSTLKSQLQSKKTLLDKMKHAIETLEQTKNRQIEQLERDKSALACDAQQKGKRIENLEQEICATREKIKEAELNNCFKANEREICCLRKKIKELETKYNGGCHQATQGAGGRRACPRHTDCKHREPVTAGPCCQSAGRNKCPPVPKACDAGCVDNGRILDDLKQMYCNLEQFKETHLGKS